VTGRLGYHPAQMDLIRVVGLELRCIVGLRSYERRREQRLTVDISLGLDLSLAGRSGQITDSVDYAAVADEVTALLRFREYRLLEVAAEEASALLFSAHPVIQQVRLRLDKPEALAGRARAASVEMTRSRGAFGATEEATEYGGRVELLKSPEGIVEHLRVDPQKLLVLKDPHDRLEIVTSGSQGGRMTRVKAGEISEHQAEQKQLLICRCLALPASGKGDLGA
jgi:dihydroneopterin aldolase